ncbi:hypothetical protein JOM56_013623 [Amanita muscaria]
MSNQDQFSSSPHSVYGDATINHDSPDAEGQGGLLNNRFPSSRSFVEIGVDSVIESIELCRQRLNENVEAMKMLYHRRQSMMEKSLMENPASLAVPSGGAFLPFAELGFGRSEIDAFQYRLPEGLGIDIPRHADTLSAAGPPVYTSMRAIAQQQTLVALSRNTQTNMAEIGDGSLPCQAQELADYHDKRTAPLAPVYARFPQSINYGHAQEIAFGSASSCQTISPAALVGTSDKKDGHVKSSVAALPRDGPSVLSFVSGGIKHYRCECGYESTRKGDVHHHIESLQHSERKYECSCGKKFTRYDSLNRHRKRCKN